MEERKLRQPEEKQELSELWELFRSQERELHEMRIRLSRFMTKGAPVFLQPSAVQAKISSHRPNFQPHVHFSRSLTNGSSGEQSNTERIPDALDEAQSKLHKGRPPFHPQAQQMLNDPLEAETLLDKEYNEKTFEDIKKHEVVPIISKGTDEIHDNAGTSKKKSVKKLSLIHI